LVWGTELPNLFSHKAILDYLNACGYNEAFMALKSESENQDFIPDGKQKYAGLLEKKWTSVIRLQKKVCFLSSLFFLYSRVNASFIDHGIGNKDFTNAGGIE
jgi:hypothetical protein